jgi:hypothetical protein
MQTTALTLDEYAIEVDDFTRYYYIPEVCDAP